MMNEIKYKKVPLKDYPGYSIDTNGVVYSEDRTVKRGNSNYTVKSRVLKKVLVSTYNCVYLYNNGMIRRYVTSLMRDTFLTVKGDRTEVNHIDCDRTNDKLENLEMMNRSENVFHSWNTCRKKDKSNK